MNIFPVFITENENILIFAPYRFRPTLNDVDGHIQKRFKCIFDHRVDFPCPKNSKRKISPHISPINITVCEHPRLGPPLTPNYIYIQVYVLSYRHSSLKYLCRVHVVVNRCSSVVADSDIAKTGERAGVTVQLRSQVRDNCSLCPLISLEYQWRCWLLLYGKCA